MGKNHDLVVTVKRIKKMKNMILYMALCIVVISLLTVYSATIHKGTSFFYKEIVWIGLGIVTYFTFAFIDYRVYGKYYKIIYLINVIFLLLVFIIGDKRLGAQRWIDLGFITIQPSEFSKLFIVLTFSEVLATKFNSKFSGLKNIVATSFHIIPIFLLIAAQPDLGTSLVIVFLYLVLVFINGIDWKTIILLGIAGISMAPIGYFFLLKDYQKERVLTFLNPEADLLGSGWNVTQSMIAVGSGGVFGKGFLQGTQSKLRFLPESHTDFIAAVFLEERGLVGGCVLLVLYVLLLWGILRIGDKSEGFGKLICYGISAIFFFHIVINVGMVTGIMPVTGLPLLLMSYGGTSFLFAFAMLGIVQSINVYRE
ncbi:MAG: rod shape-determining protein RodA [Cetobacterium sp.]|uniref:rod shape-determining protein RodA n=1 Tax=unclassified Cetobacterium TaxID=2630983 RepID=UPI000645B949|nr:MULTISPECIES: rod shape-determining protein RodA [unclassified Cetobacterium]